MYTVIPSNSSATPSCANVTFPSPLQVDATVVNGPMSQYGWIDQVRPFCPPAFLTGCLNNSSAQCTDISLVPRNGTPPYTMTVSASSI